MFPVFAYVGHVWREQELKISTSNSRAIVVISSLAFMVVEN
jgi:hypothetical protein